MSKPVNKVASKCLHIDGQRCDLEIVPRRDVSLPLVNWVYPNNVWFNPQYSKAGFRDIVLCSIRLSFTAKCIESLNATLVPCVLQLNELHFNHPWDIVYLRAVSRYFIVTFTRPLARVRDNLASE